MARRGELAAGRLDAVDTALNGGAYTDDGTNNGTGDGAGTGIWTVSPRLTHDAHFAGVPKVTVDVASAPENANLSSTSTTSTPAATRR